MTDREAIKALKLEGGLEISGKPRRAAEFLEGLSVAESALQERIARERGCRYCSIGADMKNGEDMEMDLFNYAEGMDFSVYPNFCPMCGRKLKGVDNETT